MNDFISHPVMMDSYNIPTNAINEFVNFVYNVVNDCRPSGMVLGFPQTGKSSGIKYFMSAKNEIFKKDIPCYHYSCRDPDRDNRTKYISSLLTASHYALDEPKDFDKALQRIAGHLACQAKEAGDNRVIFFIDEGQWLSDADYRSLIAVFNKLNDDHGIHFITILVGQHQLSGIKSGFMAAGDFQIVQRFMSRSMIFYGLKNLDDYQTLLQGFDEGCEFPENSGITYTQAFIPKAYAGGFRLKKISSLVKSGFDKTCRDNGLVFVDQICMRIFHLFIIELFRTLAAIDNGNLIADSSLIERVILKSVLEDLETFNACNITSQKPI